MYREYFKCLGLLLALATANPAAPQSSLLPPGATRLAPEVSKFATTTTVLTNGDSRDQCLSLIGYYSDRPDAHSDYTGPEVRQSPCTVDWYQSVWIEEAGGGPDRIRIRIGQVACLTSLLGGFGSATMRVCGDHPTKEVWTVRGYQLVGGDGKCLAARLNSDTVFATDCDPSQPNQKWQLESMRAVANRLKNGSRTVSGFDTRSWGLLPGIIEEHRPRFQLRELTAAERVELQALSAPFQKVDFAKQRSAANNGGKVVPVSLPWSTVKRLSALAESGDKEAMYAIMKGLALAGYTQGSRYDATDPKAFRGAEDTYTNHQVVVALSKLWAAHYWHRHGPDRIAALAFSQCDLLDKAYSANPSPCHGYGYKVQQMTADDQKRMGWWQGNGKKENLVPITGIQFVSATDPFAVQQIRFVGALEKLATDRSYYIDGVTVGKFWAFAEETGQLALWDNVNLNSRFAALSGSTNIEMGMRKALDTRREAAEWEARLSRLLANPAPTMVQIWEVNKELYGRSQADVIRFAVRFGLNDKRLLPMVCGSGMESSAVCQKSTAGINAAYAEQAAWMGKAKAEEEARYQAILARQEREHQADIARSKEYYKRKSGFFDQLAGVLNGFANAAAAGSEMVTVRQYDRAGNYLGSRSMTRSSAMGFGAQAGN